MSLQTTSPLPSCVFWNMRFMSVHVQEAWRAKLENTNHLVDSHHVVRLSEIHVDDVVTAEMLFFKHVFGAQKFVRHGLAFLLQEAWANARDISDDGSDSRSGNGINADEEGASILDNALSFGC